MHVATACPHCSARFQVAQAVIGKRTRCTKCGKPFVLSECTPTPPVTSRNPSVSKSVSKADSIDSDFEGSTPEQINTAQAPPVPSTPPDFENENVGIDANTFDVENNWQRKPVPVSREYRALRVIARILEVLAIVLFVLLIIAIAFASYEYSRQSNQTALDLSHFIGEILVACFAVGLVNLTLFFFANMIRLNIQIERNTYNCQECAQGHSAQLSALLQKQKNSASEKEVLRKSPVELKQKD